MEFAVACGYELDDWQKWLIRWAFVRRPDGLWAARDWGVEVCRQNGKNVVLEVIELFAVLMLGESLVVHSAHLETTSNEHFLSLKARIESSDELMPAMADKPNNGFQTANGKQQLEFRNGARIVFRTRMGSTGRGPRPQRIVFDEALVLEQNHIGSMAPGITAQRNPQLIFASSPPRATSTVQHALRRRMLEPVPGDRLFYAAWNNPEGTDADDRDAWYAVNPSLGYGRMTEESLNANRLLLSQAEYAREHLGIPERPLDNGSVWDAATWSAMASDAAPSGQVFVAVDSNPERTSASVAVAGGGVVALVHPRPSLDELAATVVRVAEGFKAPVALDPSGPASWLKPALERAGIELVEVGGQRMGQACGLFFTDVRDGKVLVRRHPDLDAAAVGARRLVRGDSWVWARRDVSVDVSPLVAVTLAWWAASQAQEAPKPIFAA